MTKSPAGCEGVSKKHQGLFIRCGQPVVAKVIALRPWYACQECAEETIGEKEYQVPTRDFLFLPFDGSECLRCGYMYLAHEDGLCPPEDSSECPF